MNASPQVNTLHASPVTTSPDFFHARSSAAAPASGENSAASTMLPPNASAHSRSSLVLSCTTTASKKIENSIVLTISVNDWFATSNEIQLHSCRCPGRP
jgi:hypothetical protein